MHEISEYVFRGLMGKATFSRQLPDHFVRGKRIEKESRGENAARTPEPKLSPSKEQTLGEEEG